MKSLSERFHKIIIDNECKGILVILLFAALNDALRIPGTAMSFFRLMFPISLYYIYINRNFLDKDLLVLVGMLIAIIIQEFVYCLYFYPTDSLPVSWMVKYTLLYVSIWCIFPLVKIIKVKYDSSFRWLQNRVIFAAAVFLLVLYVMSVYKVPSFLMNRNNYACCMAAVFPWLLINGFAYKKITYHIVASLFVFELYWGDSKAVLMGLLVQLAVYVCLKISQQTKYCLLVFGGLLFAFGGAWLWLLLNEDMMINHYHISKMFVGMMNHIYNGEIYTGYLWSLEYRTNTIIYMLQTIRETFFFGVGPGNTGRILAMKMPEFAAHLGGVAYLSPHNALLAFVSDSGWFACFILGIIVRYTLMCLKNLDKLTIQGEFGLLVFSSFFMWNISASELFTIYLVFIVFAMIFESEGVKS